MIRWGAPIWLNLLWLWPLLALALWGLHRRRRRRLDRLVRPDLQPAVVPGWHPRRPFVLSLLWLAGLTGWALALARPQWGHTWEEVREYGLDLAILIDTSRSMLAEDVPPDRMVQARFAVRELVPHLRGDRVALVPFSGRSVVHTPLTSDLGAILGSLDDIRVGVVPRGGTNIADALETALQAFRAASPRDADRAILIIGDGEAHEGRVEDVIPRLQRENIRVFAMGVGTLEGGLIPVPGPEGGTVYLRDPDGHVVNSRLVEETLRTLAMATGGLYIRTAPGDYGIERLLQEGLAPLQRGEDESRLFKVHEERYAWFLAPGLLVVALEAALRRGRRPRRGQEGVT